MQVIPRALAAVAVASASCLVALPGGAQEGTVPVPRAEAQANAVRVSLFGNELLIGEASTTASSAPSATAQGTGAFFATSGFGETSASADASTPTAGSEEPQCSELSFPDDLPLPVGAVTACSSSVATATEGAGSGTASADAVELTVDLGDSPIPLGDVTEPIVDPLLDLLGQLPLPVDGLAQLQTALDLALAEGGLPLITISSGTANATSTASATAASATARAGGFTVSILGGLVATITIGESLATATFDGDQLSAEHVVAPVSITPGAAVVQALGLPDTSIPVPPGQTIDLPLPAPLTSRITVADGEDAIGDTTARSTAANLRLDLATGLPGGGIVLAVADAAAAVERPAAPVAPPAEPPAAEPPTVSPAATPPAREALPRTGGEGHWVPTGVLLGVGASITVLVMRRTRRPAGA